MGTTMIVHNSNPSVAHRSKPSVAHRSIHGCPPEHTLNNNPLHRHSGTHTRTSTLRKHIAVFEILERHHTLAYEGHWKVSDTFVGCLYSYNDC